MIGGFAFFGNRNIQTITIPNSIESIEMGAFSSIDKLTKIVIPENVNKLDVCIFLDCFNLESVVIESNIDELHGLIFTNCNLKSFIVPDTVKIIRRRAFANNKHLSEITLSKSLEVIDVYAFTGCPLIAINLPSTTRIIMPTFVHRCDKLEQIHVSEDNEYFRSVDGVLFSKDMKKLIRYPDAKRGDYYQIPSGVVEISDYAFSVNLYLATVGIPDSVKRIGKNAFDYSQFKEIKIPASVTSIGNAAFRHCTDLKKIEIAPENIGKYIRLI